MVLLSVLRFLLKALSSTSVTLGVNRILYKPINSLTHSHMANPKGAENVSSCVPEELARQIGNLAAESGISRSRYVRALLEEAVGRRRVFRLRFEELTEMMKTELNKKDRGARG